MRMSPTFSRASTACPPLIFLILKSTGPCAPGRLAWAVVKLVSLPDENVTNFLSREYGVPAINLSYFEIDPAVVKLIPFETAKRYQILPLSRVGASLTIAMVDPTNVFAMDDIKFMTGFN